MLIVIISMVVLIVIVFISLVVFMQKVFSREVTSATSHLDKLAADYALKEEAIKKQFEDAKRQSQEIIANAQKDAQQQKEALLKQCQDDKNKIVGDAHREAEEVIKQADNARLALLGDIEQKINERAVVQAADLLAAVLPDELRSQIHKGWIVNLIEGSFENLDRLKLQGDMSEIKVVSAFALEDAHREALKAKMRNKLGVEVRLIEEIDPRIIAGMVVTLGSICLDGSLRFKIQEVARGRQ